MKKILIAAVFFLSATVLTSCLKDQEFNPETEAMFPSSGSILQYYVRNLPGNNYKVPVGLTNVSDVDQTVTISISSPTGAVEGTHYNVAGKSIVIPAGEAIDSISISGIYSAFSGSRIDTLLISVQSGDGVPAAGFGNVQRLVLQQYCEVVLSNLEGLYANSMDGSYGPYPTRVMSTTPISATSAKIVVRNVYDYGLNDLEFTLDWSDPANFKVSLEPQNTGADASIRFTGYDGNPLWIYPVPGSTGTFSSCSGTINLVYRFGIPGIGYGGAEGTDMAR